MADATSILRRLTEEAIQQQRFVQDSPVRLDVWRGYLEQPRSALDLLLIPQRQATAGGLATRANDALDGALEESEQRCIYNQSLVACRLRFRTLVTRVLPLSPWWKAQLQPHIDHMSEAVGSTRSQERDRILVDLEKAAASGRTSKLSPVVLWWIRMASAVLCAEADEPAWPDTARQLELASRLAADAAPSPASGHPLFAVGTNRAADAAMRDSVRTVKADAARELFDISCASLAWAVIDSGIDASHPAFATATKGKKKARPRVIARYDFTRLDRLLLLASSPDEDDRQELVAEFGLTRDQIRTMSASVSSGKDVDWGLFEKCLAVRDEKAYFEQLDPHGTQVAGILAATPRAGEKSSAPGVCPDITLLDLRVLKSRVGNERSEFNIISALQFVRYLNRDKDKPIVHGANLSLSLRHSVADYGCGQTPVCEECERLVASGVVTVVAAGNFGFDERNRLGSAMPGSYGDITVTDPGNAEAVITVGSTHGKYPHRYGVSYFSSRGPTGDGRPKPDLVAPGEGITAPTANQGYELVSGTSMATPHVSGAAALLMARHPGLIGDPARVKRILRESAVDLRRNRDFQGDGLVDVLRAIGSL